MGLPDKGIQADADAAHDTLVSELERVQGGYNARLGRYAQVLRTSEPPADGALATPDLTRKPADRSRTAADIGIVLPASEVAYECHEYLSPDGPGLVAISTLVLDGETWTRATGVFGPEVRTHDWQKVTITI